MEKIEIKNQILDASQDLLKRIGFEAEIKILDDGFNNNALPVVSIESEKDLSMLIGKNGQNLSAFEHLVRLIVFRKNNSEESKDLNFIVDVNDYRKSRARYILDLARTAANRVIISQRAEALSPMSSYERRLVHTELASNKDIQTESIGEEPRRRIVIKPLLI
jgi:spoIIIJ-associated protein